MNNYYINHKNNEKLEVIKDKNEKIEGHCWIELRDNEGNIQEESYSTNLLTIEGIKTMFLSQFKAPLSNDENTFNLSAYGALFLLRSDIKEDKTIKEFNQDEIVGFANISGNTLSSNPKQGTVLLDMCNFDSKTGEIDLYFKFASDKANGSFNTILFSAEQENFLESTGNGTNYTPKAWERVELTSDMLENAKYLLCNNNNVFFYIDRVEKKVYECNLNLIGNVKSITKKDQGEDLVNIPDEQIISSIYHNNTFLIFTEYYGDIKIYQYDDKFNFLRKYENSIALNNVLINNENIQRFYSYKGYILHLQENYDNECYITFFKLTTENTIKLIKQDVKINGSFKEVKAIYSDNKYIYIEYQKPSDIEGINYVGTFKIDEVIENEEVIDFNINLVNENIRLNQVLNAINTNGLLHKDTFLCVNNLSWFRYGAYFSTSIKHPGSIVKLPNLQSKTSSSQMFIHYRFKVNLDNKGL